MPIKKILNKIRKPRKTADQMVEGISSHVHHVLLIRESQEAESLTRCYCNDDIAYEVEWCLNCRFCNTCTTKSKTENI